MIVIGADPGLTGAIAVLSTHPRLRMEEVIDMPIEAKGKRGNQIDCGALLAHATRLGKTFPTADFLIVIEQVHAMKGQGVSSMFSLGQSYGALRMFAHYLTGRVELVHPSIWKKATNMVGKEKDFARTRARRLYPAARDMLARKKDVGRADALLIAHYAHLHLL